MSKSNLNFCRYQDSDAEQDNWDLMHIVSGKSGKCPTYINKTPLCHGSCPSGVVSGPL